MKLAGLGKSKSVGLSFLDEEKVLGKVDELRKSASLSLLDLGKECWIKLIGLKRGFWINLHYLRKQCLIKLVGLREKC